MGVILESVTTIPLDGNVHSVAVKLLMLALVQAVLVGPMLMPALAYSARKLLIVAEITIRRVCRIIIDKVIESIIIALAALLGGLPYADLILAVFR
jgi:hypothetical protein